MPPRACRAGGRQGQEGLCGHRGVESQAPEQAPVELCVHTTTLHCSGTGCEAAHLTGPVLLEANLVNMVLFFFQRELTTAMSSAICLEPLLHQVFQDCCGCMATVRPALLLKTERGCQKEDAPQSSDIAAGLALAVRVPTSGKYTGDVASKGARICMCI